MKTCFAVPELPADKVKRCDQGTGECEHVCEDTPSGIKCSCFDGFLAKGPSCIGNPYAHSDTQIHRIFRIFISFEKSQTRTPPLPPLSLPFFSHSIFQSIFSVKFACRLRIDYLPRIDSLCSQFSTFPFDVPVFHLPHFIYSRIYGIRENTPE